MFKFPSQKTRLSIFLTLLTILFWGVIAECKVPFRSYATVEFIVDDQHIIAFSDTPIWNIGEILPIISQNAKVGVFAYGELVNARMIQAGRYQLKLKLIRQSRKYLIQQGDYIKRLDLDSENLDYVGTTDLIVKKSELNISSKYRPFVYQGVFIGETAETLYKDEILINFLGNAYYGVTESVMVGSYLPLNIFSGFNGSTKVRVYDSESTTLATGLSYSEIKNESEATLNLNLYWDSVSSDTLISHVYLSLGLIKWEGAGDAVAVKTLGSSSFQTGYEVIMSNWDRFLIGPSYNFDIKTLGGYLSYVWIWDRFHAQVSLNTTNVVSSKASLRDGYYVFFDLYWRL